MDQEYLAFYWTFPVPWTGFRRLPAEIEDAARASRTIRHSRAMVQAFLSQSGGRLLPDGEIAVIELAPDRGSPELGEAFLHLLRRAEARRARVALVDFSGHRGWRSHQYLARHHDHPCCTLIPASLEDVHLSGFNPFDNFEAWRDRNRARIAGKPDHRQKVLEALLVLDGTSIAGRARALNDLGLATYTGKAWTAESLRKFLVAHSDR